MLSEKVLAEELDENNQKRLQNVGKFLYYPTILMVLNSLEAVQTNPKIKNVKQITHFIDYSATHPGAISEYRISGMIIHIYFDASHI